ncbi:MAG: AMP-binding protein [Thermodesulfobacteriota bacterium]
MGLHDFTVYSIIKRNATVRRDEVGWVCGDGKLTHHQYKLKVDHLANRLGALGLTKGDRLAVVAKNSLEYMLLYGAAAKTAAIMAPINWRLSADEIAYQISDSRPKFLFVESEFIPQVGPAVKTPEIKGCWSLDQARDEIPSIDDLFSEQAPALEEKAAAEDPLVILYTAAVDVRPRGAVLTHQGVLAANFQYAWFWRLGPQDVHLAVLPLFHIMSLGLSLAAMQAGGTNVIIPKFDPDAVLKHIKEDKVTYFIEFPPILETLLNAAEKTGSDLSSLRIVGGLNSPEVVRRFESMTKAIYWTAFGQSETSGLVAMGPYFERPGSAGRVGFLSEVEIADEYGRLVPPGRPGEIVVRGPQVFKGYWGLPQETEYTFRDGWHHTGDLGRLDQDGYLFYLGRTPQKELIKPGGENVYPAEVERAILEHPQITAAAVIGVPDAQWGEAVKAVCVPSPGASLTEAELVEFVAARIARFKKPKYVQFVPELPKTAAGQTDRAAVKSLYGSADRPAKN